MWLLNSELINIPAWSDAAIARSVLTFLPVVTPCDRNYASLQNPLDVVNYSKYHAHTLCDPPHPLLPSPQRLLPRPENM
ncbi:MULTISPECIES: hypothetical protein [Kamptonema]|uniref:hypothetical protein n=1 Tax=Kamptonema TaxID=1501433 RepID=UPI0011D23208|nr:MULTISPECIES: hypothetical protein [Kamptonema]